MSDYRKPTGTPFASELVQNKYTKIPAPLASDAVFVDLTIQRGAADSE